MSDLISRESVLDFLTMIPIDLGYREVDDIKEFVKKMPSAQEWIPVSERLPEEEGCYIVSIDPFYCLPVCICIDLLHFIDGKWQYEYEGKMEEWKDPVLAWMPLPEPFKGGDAE